MLVDYGFSKIAVGGYPGSVYHIDNNGKKATSYYKDSSDKSLVNMIEGTNRFRYTNIHTSGG